MSFAKAAKCVCSAIGHRMKLDRNKPIESSDGDATRGKSDQVCACLRWKMTGSKMLLRASDCQILRGRGPVVAPRLQQAKKKILLCINALWTSAN
jgi:hypothetical protein